MEVSNPLDEWMPKRIGTVERIYARDAEIARLKALDAIPKPAKPVVHIPDPNALDKASRERLISELLSSDSGWDWLITPASFENVDNRELRFLHERFAMQKTMRALGDSFDLNPKRTRRLLQIVLRKLRRNTPTSTAGQTTRPVSA